MPNQFTMLLSCLNICLLPARHKEFPPYFRKVGICFSVFYGLLLLNYSTMLRLRDAVPARFS